MPNSINKLKIKFIFTLISLAITFIKTIAQEVIVDVSPSVFENDSFKIDPARFHKIWIAGARFGSTYADDRAFNGWLKRNNWAAGNKQFFSIGLDFKYIEKKNIYSASLDWANQLNDNVGNLQQTSFLVAYGRTLKRINNQIWALNFNIGGNLSRIKFGSNPPQPLLAYNMPNDVSELCVRQLIAGPSVSFNKLFSKKTTIDRGLQIGVEAGVHFTFKGKNTNWQYGYYDDDTGRFYGEKVSDVPKPASNFYT